MSQATDGGEKSEVIDENFSTVAISPTVLRVISLILRFFVYSLYYRYAGEVGLADLEFLFPCSYDFMDKATGYAENEKLTNVNRIYSDPVVGLYMEDIALAKGIFIVGWCR